MFGNGKVRPDQDDPESPLLIPIRHIRANGSTSSFGNQERSVARKHGNDMNEVASLLTTSSDEFVLDVLRRLGPDKERLLHQVWEEQQLNLTPRSQRDVRSPAPPISASGDSPPVSPRASQPLHNRGSATRHKTMVGKGQMPVLKFASNMFFASESEAEVELMVLRIGDCSLASEVSYRTVENTAKPGVKYHHTAGRLTFQPGETAVTFSVQLIGDDEWSPLTDFDVELLGEDSVNVITEFGRRATVRIVDDDLFPSPAHQEVGTDTIQNMIDYFKLNSRMSGICTATCKMLLLDTVKNLIFVIGLFVQVFLVDYALKPPEEVKLECPISWVQTSGLPCHLFYLYCIVCWQVIAFAAMHIGDYRSISWRLAGMSRIKLQSALMRSFLHHDEKERPKIKRGDLEMTINVLVPDLVQCGYMKFLGVVSKVAQLAMLLGFQLMNPIVFNKPFRPTGIISSICFPPLLLSFFWARRKRIEDVLYQEQRHRADMFEHVEQTSQNYHLVTGFGTQTWFVEKFETLIRSYNDAVIHRLQVGTNNVYYAKWWTTLVVAFFSCWGGWQVLQGTMTLGLFLANVAALQSMGGIWDGIYSDLLEIEMSVPGLRHIMRLLNLTSDSDKRMAFQRSITSRTRRQVQEHETDLNITDIRLAPDQLPFQIKQLEGGVLKIRQGSMVAVVGQCGSGKGALLQVLGGVKFPERQNVTKFFMPSHLRVVHIGESPLLFRGSLLENLTFGDVSGFPDDDEAEEMAIRVCRRLGVSDSLLRNIREKNGIDLSEELSVYEKQLLCLARGFIANPNLLIMHTPTLVFDPAGTMRVLQVIRDFVNTKGFEEDEAYRKLRRPRTCMFSTIRTQGVQLSDQVVLAANNSFREVDVDTASAMLAADYMGLRE